METPKLQLRSYVKILLHSSNVLCKLECGPLEKRLMSRMKKIMAPEPDSEPGLRGAAHVLHSFGRVTEVSASASIKGVTTLHGLLFFPISPLSSDHLSPCPVKPSHHLPRGYQE